MDLADFKREYVVETDLGIDSSFGKILAVMDFGNVNYWFDEDRQDSDHKALLDDERFRIRLSGLRDFTSLFSEHVRFYYGHDSSKSESLGFIAATRHIFGKRVLEREYSRSRFRK
jgi:hypothetical protein